MVMWWTTDCADRLQKRQAMLAIEANLVLPIFLHPLSIQLRPAKIFNTPSHHRVHHGSNPAQIDTNFVAP